MREKQQTTHIEEFNVTSKLPEEYENAIEDLYDDPETSEVDASDPSPLNFHAERVTQETLYDMEIREEAKESLRIGRAAFNAMREVDAETAELFEKYKVPRLEGTFGKSVADPAGKDIAHVTQSDFYNPPPKPLAPTCLPGVAALRKTDDGSSYTPKYSVRYEDYLRGRK